MWIYDDLKIESLKNLDVSIKNWEKIKQCTNHKEKSAQIRSCLCLKPPVVFHSLHVCGGTPALFTWRMTPCDLIFISDTSSFVPLPQSPCSSSYHLNTPSTFPLRASAPTLPTWNAFAPDHCMAGAFPPFGGCYLLSETFLTSCLDYALPAPPPGTISLSNFFFHSMYQALTLFCWSISWLTVCLSLPWT